MWSNFQSPVIKSFNLVTEQMAFNHYPGWYHDSPPAIMAESIKKRSKEVGKRIAISEYGAGANIAHHAEGAPVRPMPRGPFHPEEYQAYVHEQEWGVMRDNPLLWGTFVWNMFDFAHQGRKEGNILALNDKGMVTHDRAVRKDAFYFYKANWNPEPMIHITARRSTLRTQPITEVKVYSNAPEVELMVNGQSCGKAKPDDLHIARWPSVQLQPGENTVKATAKTKEGVLTDSCTWTLPTKQ